MTTATAPENALVASSAQTRFQIVSDLHLETPRMRPMYPHFDIEPRCDNLVLLGDIGYVADDELFAFIERQLAKFKLVLYVFGNHESYHMEYSAAVSRMTEFETEVNQQLDSRQFVFLNRTRFDIDNAAVLGCSLFSQITDSQRSSISLFLTDFWNIASWTVDDHNAAHKGDLQWLNDQVDHISSTEPERDIIIFTHHSPTSLPEANDPERLQDSRGVRSAFVTDLGDQLCWRNSKVRLRAFGHTHFNCDFIEEGTRKRILTNQRGYGYEDSYNFDSEKVVLL